MSKALKVVENTRLTMLEDCERKIGGFFRRGIEATVGIGQQLAKIDELELYREKGYETLNRYCLEEHQMDPRNVGRFMDIAGSAKVLKDNGMELPANESQVVELTAIEPEEQPRVWGRVKALAERDEKPITAALVRQIVEHRLEELAAAKADAKPATKAREASRGSLEEPDLDLGSDLSNGEGTSSEEPTEVPTRIQLTEQGEEDLERIRRLCGEPVGDAIEHLRLQISERELHLWAQEEDPTQLTHYVVNERWSVSKALGFVNQTVTDRTPLSRLITMAMANKGHFAVELEGVTIRVDLTANLK